MALCTTPALAQDASDSDQQIAEMLLRSKDAYATTESRSKCYERAATGEIVVCGQTGQSQRMPPTSTTDPFSKEGLNDGLIRPPDLAPKYNGPVVARGCFIPPCPTGPAYYVDLDAIPEAPAGSEADLIGRGEKRRD